MAAGNPGGDAIAVKAVLARQPKHVLPWLFFTPCAPLHAHRTVYTARKFMHGKLRLLTRGAAVPHRHACCALPCASLSARATCSAACAACHPCTDAYEKLMRFDGDFISPAIVIFPLFYNTLYKQQMSFPHPPLQCFLVCYAEAGDEEVFIEDPEVFIEDPDDDDYIMRMDFSSEKPEPKWKKRPR